MCGRIFLAFGFGKIVTLKSILNGIFCNSCVASPDRIWSCTGKTGEPRAAAVTRPATVGGLICSNITSGGQSLGFDGAIANGLFNVVRGGIGQEANAFRSDRSEV